jgi:hypothetical protein
MAKPTILQDGMSAERYGQSMTDQIFGAVLSAMDDIRQSVVETPWFGREVTDSIDSIHAHTQDIGNAPTQEQGKESEITPEPEIEIDEDHEEECEIAR